MRACLRALVEGRAFRCRRVVDDVTRACPLIAVDHSLPAVRVIEALGYLAGRTPSEFAKAFAMIGRSPDPQPLVRRRGEGHFPPA